MTRLVFIGAFLAWFFYHHSGHNRLAKSLRYARSEVILARQRRAKRAAMRGLRT